MFQAKPIARADTTTEALYAVSSEAGWIYHGQVRPEKKIGFFRRRDRQPAPADEVLAVPVMTVITVTYLSSQERYEPVNGRSWVGSRSSAKSSPPARPFNGQSRR